MNILLVDDDVVTLNLLEEICTSMNFSVERCVSAEEAWARFRLKRPALVLSDIRMGEMDGISLLKKIKAEAPETCVILMTGFGNMNSAIAAIQSGAFEYLSKPFKLDQIRAVLVKARAEIERRLVIEKRRSGSETTKSTDISSELMVGQHPSMLEVFKTVAKASLSESSVLILGESGSGKELIARAIHQNSPRKSSPFIAINCGALNENLLESELFGHMKGAFTGATSDHLGLFEQARGGTLFLDEIGDISLAMQVKLLRVLQEGDYRPVGGKASVKADVRVVAATHRDLEHMVKTESFRADLFYRLKVIAIQVPSLRQRREDIPLLAEHFLKTFRHKEKREELEFAPETVELLEDYAWPGNIRELSHVIERCVVLSSGQTILPQDLPGEILNGQSASEQQSLQSNEKDQIMRVLTEVGNNKSKAAQILGINRTTLYRKLVRYGLDGK